MLDPIGGCLTVGRVLRWQVLRDALFGAWIVDEYYGGDAHRYAADADLLCVPSALERSAVREALDFYLGVAFLPSMGVGDAALELLGDAVASAPLEVQGFGLRLTARHVLRERVERGIAPRRGRRDPCLAAWSEGVVAGARSGRGLDALRRELDRQIRAVAAEDRVGLARSRTLGLRTNTLVAVAAMPQEAENVVLRAPPIGRVTHRLFRERLQRRVGEDGPQRG
jgi:hypothetical protein